jgi:hypothetical protein
MQKNRVMTQSELIAQDLDKLLQKIVKAAAKDGYYPANEGCHNLLMNKLRKELPAYIMDSRNEDFFAGEKVGRLQGHKEIVAVMETVIGPEVEIPAIDKVIDTKTAAQNRLKRQQRVRLFKAVAAISKSTDRLMDDPDIQRIGRGEEKG